MLQPRFNPWPKPPSWEAYDYAARPTSLPPDLTQGGGRGSAYYAEWRGWLCTRRFDHTGRHAAGTGKFVVAVW